MPDKLFFQPADDQLGLYSSNLQLPLLEPGSFFISFQTTAAIPTTRRGGASGLPGVLRAAPFRSKELLFRKQRSQFTTCLEAVTAVQLLKLSAAPKCSLGFPVECEAAPQGGEGTCSWFHGSSGFKANGNP